MNQPSSHKHTDTHKGLNLVWILKAGQGSRGGDFALTSAESEQAQVWDSCPLEGPVYQ